MEKYKMMKDMLIDVVRRKREAREAVLLRFAEMLSKGDQAVIDFISNSMTDEELIKAVSGVSVVANTTKVRTVHVEPAKEESKTVAASVIMTEDGPEIESVVEVKTTLPKPTPELKPEPVPEPQVVPNVEQASKMSSPYVAEASPVQTSFDFGDEPPVETRVQPPSPEAKVKPDAPSTDFGSTESVAGSEEFDIDELFD